MINVIVNGALGRMGQITAQKVAQAQDLCLAAAVDVMGSGDVLKDLDSFEGTARVELGDLGREVLKLSVTDVDGKTKDMAFYAYNVDSYLLEITDTHGMLVPAEDVDKLIRMLKQKA